MTNWRRSLDGLDFVLIALIFVASIASSIMSRSEGYASGYEAGLRHGMEMSK